MTEDRLKELRKKYKGRVLLDELTWAASVEHNGYMTLPQSDYINWLCDSAYRQITALERLVRPRRELLEQLRAEIQRYESDCDQTVKGDTRCELCNSYMFENINKIIDRHISELNK